VVPELLLIDVRCSSENDNSFLGHISFHFGSMNRDSYSEETEGYVQVRAFYYVPSS